MAELKVDEEIFARRLKQIYSTWEVMPMLLEYTL